MSARRVALATLLTLTACGDDNSVSGGADSSTSSATDSATTGGAESTALPTTDDTPTSGGTGQVCEPGDAQACACPEGQTGTQTCEDGTTFTPCMCPQAVVCGDGELGGDEVCDDGVNDGAYDGCLADCSALGPRCGDGKVNGAEPCDDGNAVDADGCNLDCVISGSALWTRGYTGEDAGNAIARGAVVDGSGNVIIVGQEFVVGQNANVWARKYDPAGDELWTWTWQGDSNGDDIAYAVALTPDGDLVVVGETFVQGEGADMFFFKLGPDSKPAWQLTYTSPNGQGDRAYGVAVDAAGNIAVTGTEYKLIGLDNVFTRVMDQDGVEIWTDVVDANAGNDGGNAVAFTPEGEVIVAGHIYVPIGLSDLWLRKYSVAGTEVWTRTADHMNGNDEWRGVSVAPDGDIALTGEVYEVAGLAAIYTAKFDSEGFQTWTKIQDSAGGDNDRGYGVAFDPAGGIVAVGSEYTANDFTRTWARKYDPTGETLWTNIHDGDGAGNDVAHAVAIDQTGHVYAAGSEYVAGQFATVWLTKYAP